MISTKGAAISYFRRVTRATAILSAIDFDTIVCIGVSGALIAPVVAYQMRKALFILRKPGEATHQGKVYFGVLQARWVFLDDLTQSGATYASVKRRVAAIARSNHHLTQHVGAYFYAPGAFIGVNA